MTLPDHGARDPQRDIVHNTMQEASVYVGMLGQTTVTIDRALGIVETRIHDGSTPGGYIMGSATAGSGGTPIARVVNIETAIPDAASPSLQLAHNFGYYPMVQVWDLTQAPAELIEVEVTFVDINTVAVNAGVSAIASAVVMFR